jgi:phage FluMu protein Com
VITYKCPKCGKTLQSPESEAGQTQDCPECGNVNRIPMPAKAGSSLPVWFLVILLTMFGCGGGIIVVCLVAITALGTSANATFGTVGNKIDARGVKEKDKAIRPKAKPAQPVDEDDKDD